MYFEIWEGQFEFKGSISTDPALDKPSTPSFLDGSWK
jgi:hypothetical protein